MNFETIKKEYETKKISYRKLAEKYNINYKAIERESKKEGWIKFQTPIKNEIINIEPPKIEALGGSEEQDEIFKRFLVRYFENFLNFSQSAKEVGKSRSEIKEWIEEIDTYGRLKKEVEESIYDKIEQEIFRKASEGNLQLLKLIAKTKMKNRGWVERQELRFEDVPPLKIEFENGKDWKTGLMTKEELEEMNEN